MNTNGKHPSQIKRDPGVFRRRKLIVSQKKDAVASVALPLDRLEIFLVGVGGQHVQPAENLERQAEPPQ